jgi:hypothetical protein
MIPSVIPSFIPSETPSNLPTFIPSCKPSTGPSFYPTGIPTFVPTVIPSKKPTLIPTLTPTSPTVSPTISQIGYIVESFFQISNCTGQTNSTATLIGICYPGVCSGKENSCESSFTSYTGPVSNGFTTIYSEFTSDDCDPTTVITPSLTPMTYSTICNTQDSNSYFWSPGQTISDDLFPGLTTYGGTVLR